MFLCLLSVLFAALPLFRIFFSAARSGYLPESISGLHPKHGTPIPAIALLVSGPHVRICGVVLTTPKHITGIMVFLTSPIMCLGVVAVVSCVDWVVV